MPYVVGAMTGVDVIGVASTDEYNLTVRQTWSRSGAKHMVDTTREVKQRYQQTKAVAIEKHEAAREHVYAMSAAEMERTSSIADRLKQRYQASKVSNAKEIRLGL
ncbi:hypothetical protein BC628DRAFT_1325225 [Trametes gibbosa]|nr:hypothetical protein BC628DRAFT_1325225 [Trametes gibbosa]